MHSMGWKDDDTPSSEGDQVQVEPETACDTKVCLICHRNFSAAKGEPKENEICPACIVKSSDQHVEGADTCDPRCQIPYSQCVGQCKGSNKLVPWGR